MSETVKSDCVCRELIIQSVQDDYMLFVKLFHCPTWPDLNDSKMIYDFILNVHDHVQEHKNGPLVIVDR